MPTPSTQDKATAQKLTALGAADTEAKAETMKREAAALDQKAQAEAKLRAAAKASKL